MNRVRPVLALGAYAGTVVVANVATNGLGFVPVGFGLTATAGTYAAGFTFAARDLAQNYAGKRAALLAVLCGALLSAVLSTPQLAIASGVAFLVSELADFAVYTPLRNRKWTGAAIVASNSVGAVVDTLLFLWLAGFAITTTVVAGQLVGKTWTTVVAFLLWRLARALPRNGK